MVNKKNNTFISYKKFIPEILNIIQPEDILEFGPGISTKSFLNNSSAKILSYETDSKWYKKYNEEIKNSNLDLRLKDSEWDFNEILKEDRDFDLIFIDGGNRFEELKFCEKNFASDAVVLLHDAHREDYFDGINNYDHIFFIEKHSCLLTNNKNIYNRIKKIKPDYSCNCKYCSTEDRKRYLSQFLD